MEIEEVVRLKNILEEDIERFIIEKFSDFEKTTGLMPTDIEVVTFLVEEMGSRPCNHVSNVNIKLEL